MRTHLHLALLLVFSFPLFAQNPAYSPIQLVNESGFEDEQVFFIAKAVLPNNGGDCFLQFDNDGIGECIAIASHNAQPPSAYAYSFVDVRDKILQIPYVNAGRLYISLGHPNILYTTTNKDGHVNIASFDGFGKNDPNFYILHDKIEFTYAELNGLFINPTAVDFFALPIEISNTNATGHLQVSGLSVPHKDVFAKVHEMLLDLDKTSTQAWQKLFVYFGNDTQTPLRFMAPGKAMVETNPASFDVHYLNNDDYGFRYIDTVWDYYQKDTGNTLKIDVRELAPPNSDPKNYLFEGQVDDAGVWVFKSPLEEVKIEKPNNSIPFFAGDGDTFHHGDNPAKAVLVKNITAAFTVGLLPAPSGTTFSPDYFAAHKNKYYEHNPILNQDHTGPWHDLYGKALHDFKLPIYTFAYDDLLAQDGTLHVDKGIATPTVITLKNMAGMTIPNPYTQKTYESVHLAVSASPDVVVQYNGQILKASDPNIFYDVTTPISVTVNDDPIDIYVEYPTVVMEPFYEIAKNIVIQELSPTTAKVEFPGEWQ